jgi:hypothetical protein
MLRARGFLRTFTMKSGRIGAAAAVVVAAGTLAILVAAQTASSQGASAAASGAATQTPVSQSKPGESAGAEIPWPLVIKSNDTQLTCYQPQLDSWDGYKLEARLAVRAEVGRDNPRTLYGIATVDARTITNKGTRTVVIDQAQVVKSSFPSATAAEVQEWSDAIARNLAGKRRTIALDRLEASLAIVEAQHPAAQRPLRNDPPNILFSAAPAILISIDGQPKFHSVRGSTLERVINTRPLLVRDKRGAFSLKIFDGWMGAPALNGPWTVLAAPSPDLAAVFDETAKAGQIDPLTGQSAPDQPAPSLKKTVPGIYVATTPTELIVTDGAPNYATIPGTALLYVTNTTANVFKDVAGSRTYVLIAGRWFRAATDSGPWGFVASNALPGDFSKIPDDSPKENVKGSVAGTDQAKEAAIAATVPQMATVDRSEAKFAAPAFDGDPVWKSIEGTSLTYAANTATPIIRVPEAGYYAVENGVWFAAPGSQGPWTVATSVPSVVYTIPPSSPLFYVTYVQVYNATPTTVYVGYAPGYLGTYIDPVTGVVVYGTGYTYDPWLGTVWYGAPVTYGYGAAVAYTPWTGWAIAFGLGWAWASATTAWGWGWGPYPYWGPWAYPAWRGVAYGARGGAVAWGPAGWAGYSGNIYTQWGNRAGVTRVRGGYDAWTGNAWAGRVGASYNSRTGVASAGQRGAVANVYTGNYANGGRGVAAGNNRVVAGEHGTAGNAYTGNEISGGRGAVYNKNTGDVTTFGHATGPGGTTVGHIGDDVYAGKDGNVYRNTSDGWQKHSAGGGWQPVTGSGEGSATRGATGGLGAGDTRGLDQQRTARQSGSERAAQFQRASSGMQHSFGGRMGGGFRRR